MNPIKTAIDHVGGNSRLAGAVGVTPQAVHNWIVRGRVPADYCPSIEKATSGRVRCEDLRPDVDWGFLRNTQAVNPENSPNLEEAA
ncbi:MAG: helix-turn-helix domain-containing protein [Azonexus sp.]|nr:helix-turn-helix domain-containing protein [Azonexus sp.]